MITTIPTDPDEARSRLRDLTNEADGHTTFSAVDLDRILGASSSLEAAAAEVWRVKGSKYADLVDVSEAGSSRRLGQLREAALAMSAYWQSRADAPAAVVADEQATQVYKIQRGGS